MGKLLAQGAEAKVYLIDGKISKQRQPKTYRHEQLDTQVRTRRTRREAKILEKAHSLGINVPKVLSVDKFDLEIEYIFGDRLSEKLNSYDLERQ